MFNSLFIKVICLSSLLWCSVYINSSGQIYWVHEGFSASQGKLNKLVVNEGSCHQCPDCCSMDYIGASFAEYENGMTMTPANELIVYGEGGLFHVDTITGALSWFFGVPPWPNWPHTHGLVTVDGTTFYTISLITPFYPGTDTLYAMNISNGIISNLGKTSYPASLGDLTLFNGEIYYTTSLNNNPNHYGIVKLDISNPGNSTLVASLPAGPRLVGLSASKY